MCRMWMKVRLETLRRVQDLRYQARRLYQRHRTHEIIRSAVVEDIQALDVLGVVILELDCVV